MVSCGYGICIDLCYLIFPIYTQYPHLHVGSLKQSQGSVVNGSSDQNPDVDRASIENSSNSKGDGQQEDGLTINSRLDELAINSSTRATVNFDKAVTNGYKRLLIFAIWVLGL